MTERVAPLRFDALREEAMTDDAGHSSIDDIIELYKKNVDRTLIRENLKLSVEERLRKLDRMQERSEWLRRVGESASRPESDES